MQEYFPSRWRSKEVHKIACPSAQAARSSPRSSSSYLERKIHPDLDSLMEKDLSAYKPSYRFQDRASSIYRSETLSRHEITEFKGLSPMPVRKEAHRYNKAGPKISQSSSNEAEDVQIEASHSTPDSYEKDTPETEKSHYFTPPVSPGSGARDISAETGPSRPQIMRWPTFGKRPGLRQSRGGNRKRSSSTSTAHSSLNHLQGQDDTTPYTPFNDKVPRTPGSRNFSIYSSTPNSRSTTTSVPMGYQSDIPSPNTFGIPSPPGKHIGSRQHGSYFTFKEVPPPLPPLSHPAFRDITNTTKCFPRYCVNGEFHGQGKFARHTHSLPSLTRAKTVVKASNSARNFALTHKRTRSQSSAILNDNGHKTPSMPSAVGVKKTHSRNHSKSSIASSRRSSAEFSARQASLISHERECEGGWEVQVSREMVRLALGEDARPRRTETISNSRTRPTQAQAGISSHYGKARCKNQEIEEQLPLGSPFLLQDTHPNNLTDKLGSDYFSASTHSGFIAPNTVAVTLRNNVMSHGELKNSTTGSSAQHTTQKGGNEVVAGTSSTAGSISRRDGGRAISTPTALTRTPSPHPTRLDTTSQSVTIQGNSLLFVPPTLSVTSPTPEASPNTPSRRTHSKSLPTSSVLRTPITPPVIEKSFSSNSGKRKAEEAGVGGDKTPPKEHPRATFAPDPRTHRASVTSGGSSGHAPSSYNRSKRVRLTGSSDGKGSTRSISRNGSLPTPEDSPPNAKNTGSWSSRGSHRPTSTSSHAYGGPPVARSTSRSMSYSGSQQPHRERAPSRRSLSQASIPLSALISPHAPSINASGTFHMRDPRKPNTIQSTPWSLSFPSQIHVDEPRWAWKGWVERGGSPLHAWLFFIGFIIFPLWWAAALFIPIPATRRLGGTDAEKAVMLDDPQVEHDARSWRTRCRFMAVVSLFTYIPFIVLIGIFA